MIVTTRYAEDKLKTVTSKLAANPLGYVAVRFNPSSEDPDQKEEVRLQLVVNSLKPIMPEEATVQLYFLHGGDIILITREVKLETLKIALQHLSEIFPRAEDSPHLTQIYDFSVHFEKFQTFVAEQFTLYKERLAAESAKPEENKNRVISVDPAYAQNMLTQRAHREGLHIMLVEDDAFTLQLVHNVLSEHTIIRAMDGFDAVESYMLNAPNIVFLDIGLPTLTGHEVLAKILEFDPNAFIVMLSGNSFMEDVAKAMKNGAKGFVAKPFPKEKLINYVDIYKSKHV